MKQTSTGNKLLLQKGLRGMTWPSLLKTANQKPSTMLAASTLLPGRAFSVTTSSSGIGGLRSNAFLGLRQQSVQQSVNIPKGIQFGQAPKKATESKTTTSSTVSWQKLASQAASGGATSLLGKSGLLGSVGLGTIISGLAGLFGKSKKSEPAPLPKFSLPDPVLQTVHMDTKQAVHEPVQVPSSQWIIDRSDDIAKAVRSAMLNSHVLNDVVSEL